MGDTLFAVLVLLLLLLRPGESLLGTEELNLDLDEPRPVLGLRPVYAFQIFFFSFILDRS